jgi:hypothetical protein
MTEEIAQLDREWPMGRALDLPDGATVLLAGMYKGRVAELLENLYQPGRIVGYDPQLWALAEAEQRMRRLGVSWEMYSFAIGTRGEFGRGMLGWGSDACSLVNAGDKTAGFATIREALDEFEAIDLDWIDFALFNMEGYEYPLLKHLAASSYTNAGHTPSYLEQIDQIAVQFHTGLGNAYPKDEVFEIMARTHIVKIDNFPQWVLWSRS